MRARGVRVHCSREEILSRFVTITAGAMPCEAVFDVRDLLANEGISDELRRAFLVYLISHNRPMADYYRERSYRYSLAAYSRGES